MPSLETSEIPANAKASRLGRLTFSVCMSFFHLQVSPRWKLFPFSFFLPLRFRSDSRSHSCRCSRFNSAAVPRSLFPKNKNYTILDRSRGPIDFNRSASYRVFHAFSFVAPHLGNSHSRVSVLATFTPPPLRRQLHSQPTPPPT